MKPEIAVRAFFMGLLYLASLTLAFIFSNNPVWALRPIQLLWAPFLIAATVGLVVVSFEKGPRAFVLGLHLGLAITIHPETFLETSGYAATDARSPALFVASEVRDELPSLQEGTWRARTHAANRLSERLSAFAVADFKNSSPYLYWLYPPSLALIAIGGIWILLLGKVRE